MSQEPQHPNTVPRFTPDIPPTLTAGLTPEMKWLYERDSIHQQQMEWLMSQILSMGQTNHAQLEAFQNHVIQDKSDFGGIATQLKSIDEQVNGWRKVVDFVFSKPGISVLLCTAVGAIVIFAASQGWIKADLGETRIQYRPVATNVWTTPQPAQK